MDPFAPKFYSSMQNNIGTNTCDGLNFVTCEQTFKLKVKSKYRIVQIKGIKKMMVKHQKVEKLFPT